ncbi:unnamed protein product (macronuclear) [Paramecium tetraurelia]|uniref:Uncharacterized protein n=1 Tax=Paramecium tetraurelia TaxID=5888 RepID=A0DVI8_PARTE|nr:uncharacterized protein GSPATT00020708001 [Paramecium tetraurelia]CAK87055.1 unnamed protein product [Paramecium tetraurelia]|eukprot:XP_001454452.1 hypothetical protein (macronuclear) [Paramecium tetraurelia strain d4-2]
MLGSVLIICLIVLLVGIRVRIYFRGKKCEAYRDISNMTILITGGSKGLGQETIKQLAKFNCRIIFGCRSNPNEFLEQLLESFPQSKIQYFPLDLQSWNSIKQFAARVKQEVDRIDVVINNAGIMGTLKREFTQYGIEAQFGTNYLGPFFLNHLLLDLLKKSNSPRIINVSSIAHVFQNLDFDDLNCDRWANSLFWSRIYTYRAYGNTKFAQILNAQEYSERTGVKACALHPGVVRTEVLQHQLSAWWFNLIMSIAWPIYSFFTKDSYYGCQTILFCLMIKDEELVDGGFYKDCKLAKARFTSREKAKMLWDVSLQLISKIDNLY